MAKVLCTARGGGDVAEMVAALDDTLVQFVLLKIPIGSGTFRRSKLIHLHFIGPKCGVVKRGKWNAELGNVLALFGSTAAGLECGDKETITFDWIITKLQKLFVSDDGEFSMAKIQEEYNRRIAEETRKASEAVVGEEPGSPIRNRKLAVDLGLNAESVLKAIGEPMGPLNWAAFEPNTTTPTLIQAGSGGAIELFEHLPTDKVAFGVIRMAFGTGRFRRTKRIFFHWVGDTVGAVQRSKSNMIAQEMDNLLGPNSAGVKFHGSEELQIQSLIEKMQNVFVVDKIDMPGEKGPSKQRISEEEYLEALLEEQRATSEFYGEPEDGGAPKAADPSDFDVAETLSLIKKETGGLTWGAFRVK